VAKTHCAVNHQFGARVRVPQIPRRAQLMLPFLSNVEFQPPIHIEQFVSFLTAYFTPPAWTSLLFLRPRFMRLMKNRFPAPVEIPPENGHD
jgi:hypothetical protein